ncbi:hypothetical protein [Bacillus sp. FJAT-29937]|uniref:hypothetical protein n=1 Tax=Bacillus sp. FJAT-29937 TaxID=1720553 RepID=UPI000AB1EF87|nr:hypothetical protein [Bacillus sp. FJAT-29937]
MKQNSIVELGKEFWGLLNFETDLKSLHAFLGLDDISVSFATFMNWAVFPELIPADIRQSIQKRLNYRVEEYLDIEAINMSEEERQLHERTVELIHFKYSNRISSPQRYYFLYQLPISSFKKVLEQFVKYGYSDSETIFRYYLYYKSFKEMEDT